MKMIVILLLGFGFLLGGGLYYWNHHKRCTPGTKGLLIPRTTLLGQPDHTLVRISPNGRYLSYCAPYEGVLNIWVQDLESGKPAEPHTFDKGRGILFYQWTYEPGILIYGQDKDGDENLRLYKLDLNSRQSTLLTPGNNIQARLVHMDYHEPHRVLLGLNERTPVYHDLYELDLRNNQLKRIYENNEFLELFVAPDFSLRFGLKQTAGGGSIYYRFDSNAHPQEYKVLEPDDLLTTSLIGFSPDGHYTYWLDSTHHDKSLLTRVQDDESRATEVLFTPTKGCLSSAFVHPTEQTVLSVTEEYLKPEEHVLDDRIRSDMETLKKLESGVFQVIGTSLDFSKWVVAYSSDKDMFRYYLYDHPTQKATYLFSAKKDLEAYVMEPIHPVEIKTRDGLTLTGYLILPSGSDLSRKGRPSKPVPLVLNVHGGPQVRDSWGFNGGMQWLANRGYAALQVNYRGSNGFGKAFLNAGNGEWAAKMHDDLIDAVQWAVQEKIADPQKVAIMGGSYGGYATLVGLTFTPDVFACGIDIVGPSNLETLLNSIPEYWKPALEELKRRLGNDASTPEGQAFLKSRSPLTFVEKIKKPLLIAQGANDPRVKKAESDQIVAKMKEKGLPVTYLLFPDEGHGFARPENRIAFYAVAEHFLQQVLGGRAEPMEDALKKSSAQLEEVKGS